MVIGDKNSNTEDYTCYTDLKDKTVIITGGALGIGKEIARHFGNSSANVIIVDIDKKTGNETLKELKNHGFNVSFYQMDVTCLSEIKSLFEKVKSRFNNIDILVNNAGMVIRGPSITYSESDWKKSIDVLLNGVFFCSQIAGKYMVDQKSGNIVNISSINSKMAFPEIAAYCAAKAGVNMLTKVLAIEWAKYNIRVNSILPGVTMTDMVAKVVKLGLVDAESLVRRTPMKRFASPKEIARSVLFLASEASSFMTGENVTVDGGWSAYGYY